MRGSSSIGLFMGDLLDESQESRVLQEPVGAGPGPSCAMEDTPGDGGWILFRGR